MPKFPRDRHEFDRHPDIIKALGIQARMAGPLYMFPQKAKEEAKVYLQKKGIGEGTLLVGMLPRTSIIEKSWSEGNYGWLGK